MKNAGSLFKVVRIFQVILLTACSMAPLRPVTMKEYDNLKISNYFNCTNSTEEILEYINREGEVIIECIRKMPPNIPFYLKIMATPDGLHVDAAPK